MHWFTPPACGVNPGGGEWRMIAHYFGLDDVLSSDIKGFESTVSSFCYAFADYVFGRAYNSPWSRRLACYAVLMIINAIRFNNGVGFVLSRQNTSGNWITTWLNTFCNMLYFCVVIIHGSVLAGQDPVQNLQMLKIKLYSDDNLVSLRQPWFGPDFVVKAFMEIFHIEVTSVSKGTDISMGPIWEASFLSRGFREQGGQVFCPLAMDSLMAQIYFIRVPRNQKSSPEFVRKQLQQNLDNVARELREYPRSVGIPLATEIISFIEKHGLPLSFPYGFREDFVQTKLLLQ
jgi:hypothetical protein